MSFNAGAIEGGINFDFSEFTHGILNAEAITATFPQIVIDFMENPLVALAEAVKESFDGIVESIEGVAGHFHQMGLEALKAGIDPQMFSTLAAAAQASGVSVEGLGNAFKFLEDRASTALRGDQEGLKAFADVGIKTRELKELLKDPEELFYRVADALHAMDDQGLRVRSSMELMSRAGVDMLPFLQKGREGVQDLAAQMGRLGAGVSEAQADIGEKFGLMEAEISAAWQGIKVAIAEPFLDAFNDHLSGIESGLSEFAQFMRESITSAIKVFFDTISDSRGEIDGFKTSMSELVSGAVHELGPVLKDLIGDFTKIAIDLLPLMVGGAKILLEAVEAVTKAVRYLADEWKNLFEMNSDIRGVEFGSGAFNAGILGEGTIRHIRDGSVQHRGGVNVNVSAPIHLDVNAATSQIAAKLKPHVQKSVNQAQHQLLAASRHALATRRNGGRG